MTWDASISGAVAGLLAGAAAAYFVAERKRPNSAAQGASVPAGRAPAAAPQPGFEPIAREQALRRMAQGEERGAVAESMGVGRAEIELLSKIHDLVTARP